MLKKFLSLPAPIKIELLLYPALLLYRMPFAWLRSLWAARILLNGRWSRYMGFHPYNSFECLFYRTQWINLDRYGRSQCSPILGLGNYPLKNWFHLSLPASYVYANAGAVTTLGCTIVWIFSHLVWLDSTQIWWAFVLILVLFLSSTAYAMAFAQQNYQMMTWMWFPAALYFTFQGELVFASIVWFAAGIFGITPAFFAVPIVFTIAITQANMFLVFILVPMLIYSASRVLPLLFQRDGEGRQALNQIAKLIGMTQKNVRYDRGMNGVSLTTVYFTLLYLITGLMISFSQHEFAVLPLLGSALFLINQRFLRVADEESLIVTASSLFVMAAMTSEPSLITLLAVWFALNPAPCLLSIQRLSKHGGDGSILVNEPFDLTVIMTGVKRFLSKIQAGEKVYFAYDDPNGKYSNLFDGYRVINELPLNIASERAFHLFPDWWSVAQTNYEGAPQCWGRSVADVIDNCSRWDARYAIIYQSRGEKLHSKWTTQFSLVSEFDWGDYLYLLKGVNLWQPDKPTPKWFLLRRNS